MLALAPTCKKAAFEPVDADVGTRKDGSRDVPTDVTATRTCTAETPSRARNKGETCGCARECQTGFCVDGVCCTSSCGETCMACNLASSLGECSPVPAGARPSDSSTCAASTPATCGLDGSCDGKGSCRKYVRGTECKAGNCQGDSVEGIRTCNGEGQCSETKSQPCPPYTCDPSTNKCASRCATNVQCSSGHECVSSSCGKSINGADCDNNDGCLSGFCVDHVCCNIACSGACVSCGETGSVGHCSYIAVNRADPDCNGEDATTCGRTGLCDGAGRCTLFSENTVCESSNCSGLLENTPRTCDGRGTCRDSQLVDCAPFLCSHGACESSCDLKGTDVCEPGHACVSSTVGAVVGICGKRKNGQSCTSADDCDSGQCVDGVCCENSCEGACRSCNLPSSPGRCLNVAVGAADPRKTCKDAGESACSTNGLCDGQGACQHYPAGTPCSGESCVSGKYFPPSRCDDSGLCTQSPSRQCSPFLCNGSACFGSCTSNVQCSVGNTCQNASCGLIENGTDCSQAGECKSGFCAQGVCCDGACTGACLACNLVASPGHCATVADGVPDPQGKCAVTASSTCGTTGSCRSGACASYDSGARCKAAACAGNASLTPASTCDGKGSCTTPANLACGKFACKDGACKNTCTAATQSTDCVSPNLCVNGSCTTVVPGTGGQGAGGAAGTGGAVGTGGRGSGGAPGTGGSPGTGGRATGGAPGTGGQGTGGAPGTGGRGTGGAVGTGGQATGGAVGTGGQGTGGAVGTGGQGTGGAETGGAPGTGGAETGGAPGTGGQGTGGAVGTGGQGTGGAETGGAPGTGGAEGGASGPGATGAGAAPGAQALMNRGSDPAASESLWSTILRYLFE